MGELTDPPRSQLHPRVPPLVWVLVGIALLVGAMVLVLTSGGPEPPRETAGDLTYIEGQARPNRRQGDLVASIADVTHAEHLHLGPSRLGRSLDRRSDRPHRAIVGDIPPELQRRDLLAAGGVLPRCGH